MASELSVTEYGASGDGEAVETSALQAALDACAQRGGGTVTVPAGRYLTGSLFLRDDVTLHLDAGATLVGSPDPDDYESAAAHFTGLLLAVDAANAGLTGHGTVDANGAAFVDDTRVLNPLEGGGGLVDEVTYDPRQSDPAVLLSADRPAEGPVTPDGFRPARVVFALRCEDFRLADVTFRDAPAWTVHFLGCDGVHVRGVDVDNDVRIPNSDGINPENSRNVTITDCRIVTGDHAISPKTSDRAGTGGPCENPS